jgi:hypothetical protein
MRIVRTYESMSKRELQKVFLFPSLEIEEGEQYVSEIRSSTGGLFGLPRKKISHWILWRFETCKDLGMKGLEF